MNTIKCPYCGSDKFKKMDIKKKLKSMNNKQMNSKTLENNVICVKAVRELFKNLLQE